jgi:bifunctional DNA-binding transcriptional regulator/antitoxin component of YhaV-PrlF toxin-antitoxin module
MQSTDQELNSYLSECTEDEEGNLIITFPDELLEAMGWKEGTVLDISVLNDRIILRELLSNDSQETG